jgi:hypothetical protein
LDAKSSLHRTSFMWPVAEHKAALAQAAAEHISLTALMRRAVRRELERLARAKARRSA